MLAERKTFDLFTYNGEDDLLMIRLELLSAYVDYFVIVEADKTFTGIVKKQKFNCVKFEKWMHKIRYAFITDLSTNPVSAWGNESLQRNALIRLINDAGSSDLILLSDIDEIPNPSALRKFDPARYIYGTFEQKMFYYKLSLQLLEPDEDPVVWDKARIISVGNFKKHFENLESLRRARPSGIFRSIKRKLLKLRQQRLENGGWHFSYLMTVQDILEKLRSFSHTEVNVDGFNSQDVIQKAIEAGVSFIDRRLRLRKIQIETEFPAHIVQMPEFRKWQS